MCCVCLYVELDVDSCGCFLPDDDQELDGEFSRLVHCLFSKSEQFGNIMAMR